MSDRGVLIGFAEALAAPEAVFSLLDAGFSPRLFVRTGGRSLLARRLGLAPPIEIPPPERDAAAAVAALRAAAETDPSLEAALALDDASLWLLDAAFGDGRARPRLASASGACARLALDKSRQIARAEAAGLAPPPTVTLEGPEDLRRIDRFPCIVKPALAAQLVDGQLRRGGAIYLPDAAARDRARLEGLLFPALAQPLVQGVGEGLFGFADDRGLSAWSAHRRLRMMNPHGSGASACRSLPVESDLREAAERMMAAADWRGPFMIELLRDGAGRVFFMELNGRLWGSTALARRAGLEYPAWAVAQALDPAFEPPSAPPYAAREARHLGRELVHLAFVLRGPRTDFHRQGWPSFWRSAAGVLRPDRLRNFYNYDRRDPVFVLADAVETARRQLRRGGA